MNEDVKSENLRIHSRADELIACLEGEIAKRDARIVELDKKYGWALSELAAIKAQGVELIYTPHGNGSTGCASPVDGRTMPNADYHVEVVAKAQGVVMPERRGDALEAAEFMFNRGHDHALDEVARLNAAPVQQVSVPDDFVCDSKPLQELLNATAMLLETPCQDSATYWAAQLANVEQLLAAPAAPAADAGLVDALDRIARSAASHIEQGERPDLVTVSHWANVAYSAIDAHSAKGVL